VLRGATSRQPYGETGTITAGAGSVSCHFSIGLTSEPAEPGFRLVHDSFVACTVLLLMRVGGVLGCLDGTGTTGDDTL
jgi:hypothetical protein